MPLATRLSLRLLACALTCCMALSACTNLTANDDAAPSLTTRPEVLAFQAAPTTSTTLPAPPTTAPPVVTEPPPPQYPAEGLNPGDENEDIERLQTELTALGFRTGDTIDGVYGGGTASAVMAFEKFEGLERDGIADPEMLEALAKPSGVVPMDDTAESRIEIDITRQLIFARDGEGQITILNTSTGNGQPYRASNGKTYNANTPRGEFGIYRRINGVRKAFLGSLYRPLYFKRGWAIHGSNSVPGYPASHGCARVRNDDQDWLYETFENGTFVAVYDQQEPPAVSNSLRGTFKAT